MASPRIVVIGSANVDLVTYTDQFPRPGETIFGRAFSLGFGGKGANQAVAARLGGCTTGRPHDWAAARLGGSRNG